MDSSNIEAGTGLVIMLMAVFGTVGGVLRNIRKNQEKVADDLTKKYAEGIAEGLRRAEPALSELRSELRLMTSERDQARSELGESRNTHRERGGRA
jgi:Zn-dependent protease with chaperone function